MKNPRVNGHGWCMYCAGSGPDQQYSRCAYHLKCRWLRGGSRDYWTYRSLADRGRDRKLLKITHTGKLPKNADTLWDLHKTMSMKAIGKIYGCSRQAVSLWFQRRGGKQVDHRTPYDVAKIRLCLKNARSLEEVSSNTGCPINVVYRFARYHGYPLPVKPPPPYMKRVSNRSWMRKRYLEWKWTVDDISVELECCSKVVREWLIRHRVKLRTQGRPKKGTPLPKHSKRNILTRK